MKQGFTLLEMAIVLVVMGLIIGGVMTGRGMIRSAELAGVISDIETYRSAVNGFIDKYESAPGDMPDAEDYWSECVDDPGYAWNTCNGDGDGSIEGTVGVLGESLRVWQHLGLSEMLDADYTGLVAGAGEYLEFGVNIPISPLAEAGYSMEDNGQGRVVYLGMLDPDTVTDFLPSEHALSPIDAASIDRKIDDGLPQTGDVIASSGWDASDCINTSSPVEITDPYDLEKETVECLLVFVIGKNI